LLSNDARFMRLLIIGGSDAGISAALRARELRRDLEVAVILADSYPNYSICGLPFYLSGETDNWRDLAHRTDFDGIELLCKRSAQSFDPNAKVVTTRSTEGRAENFKYDRLIVATGAKPILPDIPGIDHVFPLHSMTNSFRIHEEIASKGVHRAAIVGAGYIGVEMADALTHRKLQVQLIGRSKSVLPSVDPEIGEQIREHLEEHGVCVRTEVEIDRITKQGEREFVLEGASGFQTTAELIVWASGVVPASDLAKSAGIETGIRDACKVNQRMETNLPNVYAAGDCVETWHRILQRYSYLPLGTTAHKQGRVAGENAAGGEVEFAGSVGTQVVKVFDLAIARTGLLDREAESGGCSPLTAMTEAYDHKPYYPGAEKLRIRVTGDLRSGLLLGAQIAGHWKADVAKRIDVFATALFHRMKVDEINSLDLSYTPPLGSPWDAVQTASQNWSAMQRQESEVRKR